jgi:hypothetical protein
MANPRLDVTTDWDTIRAFLPEGYAELATELRQLNLQYGNAKIRTADDLLRLVLLHVGADLPLRQTVALMAESGGPDVSHVRLHKKLLRSVPYLRRLVAEMVDTSEAAPERWSGYEVVAVDATAVCGPGAETTDARLHTQVRIADLDVLDVRVEGIEVGESFKRFSWNAGQLAVADRGYCNAPGIGYVVERGADVLVRVNRGSLPLLFENEPFELMPWLRLLPGHRAHEIPVVIHDKERGQKISGRLVAMRLPEHLAEKARARLVRERGSHVSDLDREAASYVVLFTTVPMSRLDAERCLALYRLRWQVELLFKRWKSLCGLDRLPNHLDETIHAWLYAKVLLALLMQRMAASALSPPEVSTSPRHRRSSLDAPALEADLPPLGRHRPRAPSPRAA